MASPVIQSGDYLLEMDTGFSSFGFVLDDPVEGVLDNPTGLAIVQHIYCADKSDFTVLPAGIECLAQE